MWGLDPEDPPKYAHAFTHAL